MAEKDDYLLDLLVDLGFTDAAQVAKAREEANAAGVGVVDLMVANKVIRLGDVTQAKAAQFGAEVVNLASLKIPEDVIAMVPRSGAGRGYSQESAVIGTVQVFALACGVLFVSLYGGFLDSLTGLLFGTFLGISNSQVLILGVVGAGVLVALAVIARPLFFATVDADIAVARGVPTKLLSVLFLLLLGCTAAEVSQITGALLVFALLVMPPAAAQQLSARPGTSFLVTIVFGLLVTWLGLGAAYFSVYPVGFFVTTFGFIAYVAASAWRAISKRRDSRLALGPA